MIFFSFTRNIAYSTCIVLLLSGQLFLPTASFSRENAPDDTLPVNETEEKDVRKNDNTEKSDKNKIFGFDIGIGGGYASGISVSNFYYKPFCNLHLKHTYVKFTAGLNRYQNYLITDGEGKFETVNFTQPKFNLSLYPHKIIELYGEYRYSTGDPAHYYRGHDGTAGFFLDFDPVTIDASINKRLTQYRFKSVDWLSRVTLWMSEISAHGHVTNYYTIDLNTIKYLDDISATANLMWYVIDTVSLDATYYYLYSVFRYPKDSYYIHTGRIGVYSDVWKYISLHGGASIGVDAERYIIVGGDCGVTFNILGYVTISATYLPSYYIAPKTNNMLNRFIDLYILYTYDYDVIKTTNPYLQKSMIGKSFLNHSLNFSVMYRY